MVLTSYTVIGKGRSFPSRATLCVPHVRTRNSFLCSGTFLVIQLLNDYLPGWVSTAGFVEYTLGWLN